MISHTFACRLIGMLALILVFAALPARAELQDNSATGEDVAIAFFKTAESNPDFDLWAKGSREYKYAPPALANDILDKEKQRLMRKWRDYNGEEDVLNIRTNITVELKVKQDKDGNDEYWMYLIFPDHELTYFPYVFQDYKFAVIPQQFEGVMAQKILHEQFDLIRADFKTALSGTAYMYLQMKPVKAYIHQPYKIDNTDQWALMCDVATMSLNSIKTGQSMWNYGAAWYVSPVKQQLRDLYQKSDESVPGSGTP